MSIQSHRQLANTRKKLQLLDNRLRALETEPVSNAQTRELTKRSLKRLVNQLTEEIVRFESRQSVPSSND